MGVETTVLIHLSCDSGSSPGFGVPASPPRSCLVQLHLVPRPRITAAINKHEGKTFYISDIRVLRKPLSFILTVPFQLRTETDNTS